MKRLQRTTGATQPSLLPGVTYKGEVREDVKMALLTPAVPVLCGPIFPLYTCGEGNCGIETPERWMWAVHRHSMEQLYSYSKYLFLENRVGLYQGCTQRLRIQKCGQLIRGRTLESKAKCLP